MKVKLEEQIKRFGRLYGDVQRAQNEDIISHITGKRVLDVGCGYGFLAKQIADTERIEYVAGIDNDEEAMANARKMHQGVDFRKMDVLSMTFPENCFETVVFRESIHHLNVDRALNAAMKVCSGEIVIFDPNPNLIVRLARKLIGHEDDKVNVDMIIKECKGKELEVESIKYRDVMAFPLSGGLVGSEICPNVTWLKKLLLLLDNMMNNTLKVLGLQKHFCWRYIVKLRVNKNKQC